MLTNYLVTYDLNYLYRGSIGVHLKIYTIILRRTICNIKGYFFYISEGISRVATYTICLDDQRKYHFLKYLRQSRCLREFSLLCSMR
jgi:hypothetical protein